MKDDWRKALLGPYATMANAAEVLTKSSMRIVLVIDEHDRLLGTVTDGDIRRAVMRGVIMEGRIDEVMQKDPTTVCDGEERRRTLQLMRDKDLLQVPVVDASGRVVGLDVMQDFIYGADKPNPVLLMAGGFGRRLHSLTREIPKPLLTVGNKPILESIVEQLADAGFSRFFIAVHFKSDLVRAHFGDGSNWGVNISYLEEKEPLGTAGALGLLREDAIDAPLLVMNGDLLTRLDFSQLLDYHLSHGGVATMCVREHDFQIPYGVVQGDGARVQDITEKPVQKFFINAGIYVLERKLVYQCKGQEAKDMPDLLKDAVEAGDKVNMFPIHEYWVDIGRLEEFERARVDAAELIS